MKRCMVMATISSNKSQDKHIDLYTDFDRLSKSWEEEEEGEDTITIRKIFNNKNYNNNN